MVRGSRVLGSLERVGYVDLGPSNQANIQSPPRADYFCCYFFVEPYGYMCSKITEKKSEHIDT